MSACAVRDMFKRLDQEYHENIAVFCQIGWLEFGTSISEEVVLYIMVGNMENLKFV